ncbi:MAG: MOSC domain-containing protein [Bacteroidota bacterium]|nr:MOSC domain-containing protein [Bacteroidota bacterium]
MASVRSIIIRPAKKADPLHVTEVRITVKGIDGDHSERRGSARQVTLIGFNHLATVSDLVGFQGNAHVACRRNIMIDSLPDGDLKGKRICLGDEVILEIIKYCTPCFRMDENFGEGAIQAFDEKAGWIAKVIQEGMVAIGDKFEII